MREQPTTIIWARGEASSIVADPLSADAFIKALRTEGLKVVEVRDWRTHNRNHKGPWGPVHGVMIHHTATTGTDDSVRVCYDGRSDLPGPLCHGVIDKQGIVHLVGCGRTNHAGAGDDDVLEAVKNETDLPADNEANTDGNQVFYGFECINKGDGKDQWPAAQLEAIEKAAAALCRAHGWDADSVIGHLEWQPGKIDPKGFPMRDMRARIHQRLGTKPTPPATGSGTASTYTVRKGDTLFSIAEKHHTTVAKLVDVNGLDDPDEIRVGQKLKLPAAKTAPAAPRPAPAPAPESRYEPFPGANFFHGGRHSPIITAMGRRLVAEGCGQYRFGPGPNWTETDRRSYAAWQRKLGYRGDDADGYPGPTSWAKLRVPKVS